MKDIEKTKIYYFQNKNNKNIGNMMMFPGEIDEVTILKNIKKGIDTDMKTFEQFEKNIDNSKAKEEEKDEQKKKIKIAKESYMECEIYMLKAKDNKITGNFVISVPELLR